VKVEPAALPWRLVAFAQVDEGELARVLGAVRELQSGVDYLGVVPAGRGKAGLVVRGAHSRAPGAGWLAALDGLLGLEAEDVIRYDDPRRGASRRLRLGDGRLAAVRLSGDADALASAEWLREWHLAGQPVAKIRRQLLMPSALAPEGCAPPGRTICHCHGVTEAAIASALAALPGPAGERLAALQAGTRCGTNCGSCLPELRRMAEDSPACPPPARVRRVA
jgi:assimilatory nitrate reductase catalytic subunit